MPVALVVAGIDVGGLAKGFHAVALRDGTYLGQFVSHRADEVAAWCRQIGAVYIAVDAPCRWSATGRARTAERELMREKIWCFSTPRKESAETHPKDQFRWMLNGALLFEQLQATHALFADRSTRLTPPICCETFPQAVACALAGTIVSAKKKGNIRRSLLIRAGVDAALLTNIDKVDAALCALSAHYLGVGRFKTYGDMLTGLIVVPDTPL